MHIGEPLGCWLPLDENNPHRGYYSQHPEWYMGNKADYPSHAVLIAARDRVLARHPDLTVIGAHLGSLEYDVGELAARLDRYPNFAVDTSARLHDLLYQDRDAVRRFFIAYQDRLLFGTDVVVNEPVSALDAEARAARLDSLRARYEQDVAYYATGAEMTIRGRATQGLYLPPDVVEQLLVGNARRWYDGL
jgi:predicted TIM-barrel fold metal-dependent hydrolase